jgi:hypothetical protein
MNFYTNLPAECYSELPFPIEKGNKGKRWEDRIGAFLVKFILYQEGRLMIYTSTNNLPHKIEDELDYTRLIAGRASDASGFSKTKL